MQGYSKKGKSRYISKKFGYGGKVVRMGLKEEDELEGGGMCMYIQILKMGETWSYLGKKKSENKQGCWQEAEVILTCEECSKAIRCRQGSHYEECCLWKSRSYWTVLRASRRFQIRKLMQPLTATTWLSPAMLSSVNTGSKFEPREQTMPAGLYR